MKLPPLDYALPATLDEAVHLLATHDNARVISGGQSLMPLLAFRLATPELLVDLKRVPGLADITTDSGGVRLGARVRWCDIEADARLAIHHPLLAAAIAHVAHYQIRNRGTVGGSLAHADPAAEMPGIALTCDAELFVTGAKGTRTIAAGNFFSGPMQTVLQPDEILTAVKLPPWQPQRRWAFKEFARRKGDFAMAGVALFYDRDSQGHVTNAHVGAIGVADTPVRLHAVEELLEGRRLDATTVAAAAALARDSVDPSSDIHAPGVYRRALVGTLLERGLKEAESRGMQA